MPMLSNLNFDPRNIRLPELPMPKLPGMQGDMGIQPTFKQPGIGITPPTLKTNPLPNIGTGSLSFLPETQQAEQDTTGFVIQRNKDGSIDWFNTLAQAGALAATAIGATKGNVALASAGSGYLQGRAQGLKEYDAKQERLSIREEAKAERDFAQQEKADTQQRNTEANVREWISKGEWNLAKQLMKDLSPEKQAELNQVLDLEKTKFESEKLTKDKDNLIKTVDGLIYQANTVEELLAGIQYAENSNLPEPEKSRKIAEGKSRLEVLQKKDQVENQESAYTAAKKAINMSSSSEDLETVMALEVNNSLLTEEQKKNLFSAAEVKKAGIQRNEYLNIAKSLQTTDPETSSKYYKLAGFDISPEVLKGRFLYREQAVYNRFFSDYKNYINPEATADQQKAYADEQFEAIYDRPYRPDAPSKSTEDRAGGQSALSEVAKQKWIQGNFGLISEGKESLDQIFKELDGKIGEIEYLPNAETAIDFKNSLLDSLIVNPSVPERIKMQAREKMVFLLQ